MEQCILERHSYAVNGKYFDDVLNKLLSEKVAIDQVYKQDQKNEIGEKVLFLEQMLFRPKIR